MRWCALAGLPCSLPCRETKVWVLVHILQTSLQMYVLMEGDKLRLSESPSQLSYLSEEVGHDLLEVTGPWCFWVNGLIITVPLLDGIQPEISGLTWQQDVVVEVGELSCLVPVDIVWDDKFVENPEDKETCEFMLAEDWNKLREGGWQLA